MGADPISLALIASTALATTSTLASGYMQYENGKYQKEQANADADAAEGAARVQADRIRSITKKQQSNARAALAGSGVNVDQGTAVNINEDIGQRGEQDALTTVLQGSYNANSMRQGGRLAALQGRQAFGASVIDAGSTLASGYFNYGKWNAQKPPTGGVQ